MPPVPETLVPPPVGVIQTGLVVTVGVNEAGLAITVMLIVFEATVPQLPLVTEQVYEVDEVKSPGLYVLAVALPIIPELLYH